MKIVTVMPRTRKEGLSLNRLKLEVILKSMAGVEKECIGPMGALRLPIKRWTVSLNKFRWARLS
jgi:hypothetical protein